MRNEKLHFEVDAVVVLEVRVIDEPVPPLPESGRHLIQKLALGFVAEHVLPQALSSGWFLLPQFLLVSSLFTPKNTPSLTRLKHNTARIRVDETLHLASDPEATVQPHEPCCD